MCILIRPSQTFLIIPFCHSRLNQIEIETCLNNKHMRTVHKIFRISCSNFKTTRKTIFCINVLLLSSVYKHLNTPNRSKIVFSHNFFQFSPMFFVIRGFIHLGDEDEEYFIEPHPSIKVSSQNRSCDADLRNKHPVPKCLTLKLSLS